MRTGVPVWKAGSGPEPLLGRKNGKLSEKTLKSGGSPAIIRIGLLVVAGNLEM